MRMRLKNWILPTILAVVLAHMSASGQLLKKGDYGAGFTLAVYQFDEARSKQFDAVSTLKQTVSSPKEEADYLNRQYGVEDLKLLHVRTVGLREGEVFSDSVPLNDKPLILTMTPDEITKDAVRLSFSARYVEATVLEAKRVTVNNYETAVLKGGQGDFGVQEFTGPRGIERVPAKRSLLVTVTPAVVAVRGLQNRPSDISRPTDAFGSRIELAQGDIFVMPTIVHRESPRFVSGSVPKGTITLEGVVTPEGRVTNVRILDTPDPGYNQKAIEAFRGYRFNPATLNGRPTYATFRETIQFGKPSPL
jgi:TonB family protein